MRLSSRWPSALAAACLGRRGPRRRRKNIVILSAGRAFGPTAGGKLGEYSARLLHGPPFAAPTSCSRKAFRACFDGLGARTAFVSRLGARRRLRMSTGRQESTISRFPRPGRKPHRTVMGKRAKAWEKTGSSCHHRGIYDARPRAFPCHAKDRGESPSSSNHIFALGGPTLLHRGGRDSSSEGAGPGGKRRDGGGRHGSAAFAAEGLPDRARQAGA